MVDNPGWAARMQDSRFSPAASHDSSDCRRAAILPRLSSLFETDNFMTAISFMTHSRLDLRGPFHLYIPSCGAGNPYGPPPPRLRPLLFHSAMHHLTLIFAFNSTCDGDVKRAPFESCTPSKRSRRLLHGRLAATVTH